MIDDVHDAQCKGLGGDGTMTQLYFPYEGQCDMSIQGPGNVLFCRLQSVGGHNPSPRNQSMGLMRNAPKLIRGP